MTVAQDVIADVSTLLFEMKNYEQEKLQQTYSTVESLNSEHKRLSRFRDDGYLQPLARKIGQRPESVTVGGNVQQRMVDCEVQYVPILDTLAYILKNQSFRKVVLTGSDSNMLASFTDGTRYSAMPLWSTKGLPLQLKLYQDDIEVANPLGVNRGIYKLTMYYFSIMNIPPEYNSLLCHHHLVCVAMASDIKRFGHNPISSFIADELRQLEIGAIINSELVCGTLVALAGDNLGLNSIIGMVESFSANHYCRFCLMKRPDCQVNFSCTTANSCNRTWAQHTNHTVNPEPRETGVVRSCSLDKLDHFKAILSFTPDIMHDLLEGVIKLEVGMILDSLLSKRFFSLDELNHYIDSFNYGYTDSCNQPRLLIQCSGSVTVKQSASRMWCLFRALPVMIGELIPADCEEWELYRMLSEINSLSFRPYHTIDSTHYLDYLVEEHHLLFMKLYPAKPLTPKQHNLCHYGEAIRRNGPLTQFSAMRSEANHQLAKITAGLSCNFTNVPLTVARKYQLKAFGDWCQNKIFPENSIQHASAGGVRSITVNGSRILVGCCLAVSNGLLKVTNLSTDNQGNPTVEGFFLDPLWSPSLMAYTVSNSNPCSQSVKLRAELTPGLLRKYPHPLTIWKTKGGVECVVPRYQITL